MDFPISRAKLPCGCENRKEIMFTQGKPGPAVGAILVGATLLVLLAWRLNK